MPDKWPLANGNWSDAANWNGGTKPTNLDDVFADGRTIAVDEDVSVISIRTTQRTGGTAGGSFTVTTTRNITANITAGSSTCVVYSGNSSTTLTVVGNVSGSTTSDNASGIAVTSSGNLMVTSTGGNFPLGSSSGGRNNSHGVDNQSTGIVTVIGNPAGGSGGNGNSCGIRNASSGTVYVTGNPISGISGVSNAHGILNESTGSVFVVGNPVGREANVGAGVRNSSTGFVQITGNPTGGSASYGAHNSGSGRMLIIGNPTGGSSSIAAGVVNSSTGTLWVEGECRPGSGGAVGVSNSTGYFGLAGSGNMMAASTSGSFGGVGFSTQTLALLNGAARTISFSNAADNASVNNPAYKSGNTVLAGASNGTATAVSAANIRSGVSVATSTGTVIGTLAVPNPNQVTVGVATDNTVGTAVITEASLLPFLQQALSPNAAIAVERSIDDTKAITFSWPVSGATITGQKSIDNGTYSAVEGGISFLRTESGRHYYTLAYDADDRTDEEATIRYKMTDGTYTKYFNLRLVPPGITTEQIESSTVLAKEATVNSVGQAVVNSASDILTAVNNIEVDNTAIANAVWAKDISGATAGTAGAYLKDIWGRITAAVYTMFTNLIAMITGTGASAKWTAKVLEESPTGSVYILPTKGSQGDGRTTTSTVYVASNQSYLVVRTVTDSARALVSLTGRTLRFICEGQSGLDKTVIEDVDITVSGTSDATYSCKIPKTTLSKARSLSCVLRDVTDPDDNTRLDSFTLVVEYAADAG